ncbi:MAG TPA: CAP domain-containing protein [Thermotogota bacterium]|nr:CAP domain-containing protein [Thermotogota bacterium]
MKKMTMICVLCLFLLTVMNSFASEKYLTLGEVRDDFMSYVNEYRKGHALPPLMIKYISVAQDFAEEQAERDRYLAHRGFNDRAQMIKKATDNDLFKTGERSNSFSVYENCCWFTICSDPAKKAFDLFVESSGHRKNMLKKTTYTSIGIAQSESGTFYFCQLFF